MRATSLTVYDDVITAEQSVILHPDMTATVTVKFIITIIICSYQFIEP